jgi:hypothetical protein
MGAGRAMGLLFALGTGSAWAQGLDLPGSPPPQAPACLTVTAQGGASAVGCGGADAQALAAQHRGAPNPGALDQNAPAPALGLFNQAATKEQFGNTFGKSTVPQAVPRAAYPAPLMPNGH